MDNQIYYDVLKKMSLEKKALKVFELTEMTRLLMKRGLEIQYPTKSKEEIHQMYMNRLAECHNSNY